MITGSPLASPVRTIPCQSCGHVRLLASAGADYLAPPWSSQRSFRGIPASPAAAVPPARPQPSRPLQFAPAPVAVATPVSLPPAHMAQVDVIRPSRGLRRSRWRASPVPPASPPSSPTSGSGARWACPARAASTGLRTCTARAIASASNHRNQKQRILVLPEKIHRPVNIIRYCPARGRRAALTGSGPVTPVVRRYAAAAISRAGYFLSANSG